MRLVRPSVKSDVYSLQGNLRDVDVEELRLQGQDPSGALVQGLWRSRPHAYTIEFDGEPVGMFGVVPGLVEHRGAVWLLGSPELTAPEHSRWFLRESRKWLEDVRHPDSGWTVLYNQVYDKNEIHKRWLQWLDFEFIRHSPPFIEFIQVCATL